MQPWNLQGKEEEGEGKSKNSKKVGMVEGENSPKTLEYIRGDLLEDRKEPPVTAKPGDSCCHTTLKGPRAVLGIGPHVSFSHSQKLAKDHIDLVKTPFLRLLAMDYNLCWVPHWFFPIGSARYVSMLLRDCCFDWA